VDYVSNVRVSATAESATEVLLDSIRAECRCPACGCALTKSVFADGDAEPCESCGTGLWFELRAGAVVAHMEQQATQGSTLGELMKSRRTGQSAPGLERASMKARGLQTAISPTRET
jgi:hypothetical protein